MTASTKERFNDDFQTLWQLIVGCFLYALSLNVFYNPARLLGGGVAGFAQIIHFQFGLSISLMVILINVPLFVLALIFIDKRFTIFSLFGMLCLSLMIELTSGLHVEFSSDLTAVAIGGIINGLGLGLIYRSEASVGGTDIVAKIVQRYYSGNMAYTGLILNVFVIGLAAFIYGIDRSVLTLCTMYVASQVNSYIIDGRDHRRAVSIITSHPEELTNAIFTGVHRGVTVLNGYGAYTHEDRKMLYCVISKRELAKLKRVIQLTDPTAFFTIVKVTGVYGNGSDFHSVRKDIH